MVTPIKNTKQDHQDDEEINSPKKNPCGKCRANGLPVCKGHAGGSGGGSGDDDDETSEEKKEASTGPKPMLKPKTLEERLGAYLDEATGLDSVVILENQNALFTMKLLMDVGSITFSAKKDLSEEEQADVNELLNAIEIELSDFKKELIQKNEDPKLIDKIQTVRDENNLTLKFPSPKFYDAFVERLIDKNLMIAKPSPQQEQAQREIKQQLPEENLQSYNKPTAPNPFDISGGPKFNKGE